MKLIEAEELKNIIEKGEDYVLLDCRSPQSFETAHIPTAQCLPWAEVEENAAQLIPDKKTLVITSCSSITCDASEKCYQGLEKLGYTNLREYAGGLADWHARGFGVIGEIPVK